MQNLNKWVYPESYIGTDFSGYYRGLGCTRDSEILEISNFETLLDMLGGENEDAGVVVSDANHWLCGWVKEILVHESSTEKLKILSEQMRRYKEYPVLDEMDFSEREHEYYAEYAEQEKGRIAADFVEFLGLPESYEKDAELLALCFYLNLECQHNNGADSCITVSDNDRDLSRIADILERLRYCYLSENGAYLYFCAVFQTK